MMIKHYALTLILLSCTILGTAQQTNKGRNVCQEEYISKKFILPLSKNGPFQVKKPTDIDSLFAAMEAGWREVSADSLKKYPSVLTSSEFAQLDAYCYLWALVSITENLNAGSDFRKTLMPYMNAAMVRDAAMLKRVATPLTLDMIHVGNLGNTLTLGTKPGADNAGFKAAYSIYLDYEALFNRLTLVTDTAVSHAAARQLKILTDFYYPMRAVNSYLNSEYDQAFNFLVTGLNVDRYSKSLAIDLTKKLVKHYKDAGDADRCYALLNVLALNSTPDNLNRSTLRLMYKGVDSLTGPQIYENFKNKLSSSTFKKSGKNIKLPVEWRFIKNNVPVERLRKAKYILLDVWHTACGPCLAEIPELNAFYNRLKQREDVIFVSINADFKNGKGSRDFVVKRAGELKIEFPVYFDEPKLALQKQLKVEAYPSKFIVTNTGEILDKIDQSKTTLESFQSFLKEF